jgi:hypothetical protein
MQVDFSISNITLCSFRTEVNKIFIEEKAVTTSVVTAFLLLL